jgi:tetratricopeptide (TPR) repeat protein
VDGSIIGRWGGRQVHVLDPTRSAVVVWEEVVYANNPRDQRSDYRIHAGEPICAFDRIDYKFEEFPHQIRVKSSSRKVVKHRIGLLNLPPLQLLLGSADTLRGQARLDYVEAHLATTAERTMLLGFYWATSAGENEVARCRDFLKKSLADRPVDVEWHKTYQDAAIASGRHAALGAEYDAMLATDGENADLLYLRGRIEPYGADSAKFLEAALKNAPDHAYTWAEKAERLSSAGKFDEARPAIERAVAADPNGGGFDSTRRHVLQALGQGDAVIAELRNKQPGEDLPAWAMYPRLIEVLCLQGKIPEAESEYAKLVNAIDRDLPGDPLQLKINCQLSTLLKAKRYDEVRAAASQLREPWVRSSWNLASHLHAGQLDEAAGDLETMPVNRRGLDALCLSIAWQNAQRIEQSQAVRQQAIALLSDSSRQEQIVAGWLKEPPADWAAVLPQLADLSLDPIDKVIVLLALAQEERPGRDQLIEFATQLSNWPTTRSELIGEWLGAMR